MHNYFPNMIDDVYDSITTSEKTIIWPAELSIEQRKTLINNMITYYSKMDQYEKCTNLEKVLQYIQ
jgi:hypothetical protein